MKILWCITGAGHLLEESIKFMENLKVENRKNTEIEITVAFSNAGREVVEIYGLFGRIKKIANEIIIEREQGASAPMVGRLAKKEFNKILVMPCTANTIAKIAHGIADSLITNLVAQGVKSKIPIIIFPTDFQEIEKTKLPGGKKVIIHLRKIDIENVKRVENMEGIKVVKKFKEIKI